MYRLCGGPNNSEDRLCQRCTHVHTSGGRAAPVFQTLQRLPRQSQSTTHRTLTGTCHSLRARSGSGVRGAEVPACAAHRDSLPAVVAVPKPYSMKRPSDRNRVLGASQPMSPHFSRPAQSISNCSRELAKITSALPLISFLESWFCACSKPKAKPSS